MSREERQSNPTVGLFERAVAEHSRRLLAIAATVVGRRASAEDVVQQALLNLFQHRNRYDWTQPWPLMRQSVVNEALRVLRRPAMSLVADDQPGDAPDPADRLEREETVRRVRAAIDELPEHFRAALVLCEYEQMPYEQIAQTLGVTLAQVKTWLHRGRKQLAKRLQDS